MHVITNEKKERMMVNPKTREIYFEKMSLADEAAIILSKEGCEEKKIEELQNLGLRLEEIVKLALEMEE